MERAVPYMIKCIIKVIKAHKDIDIDYNTVFYAITPVVNVTYNDIFMGKKVKPESYFYLF